MEQYRMTPTQTQSEGEDGFAYCADDFTRSVRSEATRRPTVYVVDDDDSILTGLASLLGAAGYRVEAFNSALDFLAVPRRRPACLVRSKCSLVRNRTHRNESVRVLHSLGLRIDPAVVV